jgi:dipeptidyl aminopeptidase/acylaminoacyl peptidase
VDRGFVVLEPNVRGSTGYGAAFGDAARGDWGGGDLADVAAGARYLRDLPFVDPDRLAVFGRGHGGYLTYMALTKEPGLWRAGVAWDGATDLVRLYADSVATLQYILRDRMGDPDRDASLWADRSPIHFAQHLQARLLILHSANDMRCPVGQARAFRDRLTALGRREGADFEYAELPRTGHSSNDMEQQVHTYTRIADYLGRALGGTV